MVELVTQFFINKMIQNGHKMIILITLVMSSLQKHYRDIVVTMTGFGFIRLIAHFFRCIGQPKKSEFLVIPNFKDFEFEEIKYINLLNINMKLIKNQKVNLLVQWS